MNKILFLLVVFIVLVVGIAFFINQNYASGETEFLESFIVSPIPQIVEERTFIDIQFKMIEADYTPKIPVRLRVGENNLTYLIDYDDYIIRLYNSDAQLIDSVGKGRGRGPGEFLSNAAIHIDLNGNPWLTDTGNGRGIVYHISEDSSYNIFSNKLPINVIPLKAGEYVIDGWSTGILTRHDSTQQIRFEYEKYIKDHFRWTSVLQGWYTKTTNDEIIKVFDETGYIIKYDQYGEIVFFREGISVAQMGNMFLSPQPTLEDGQSRYLIDTSTSTQVSRFPSVVGDELHVMIGIVKEDTLSDAPYFISGELMDVFDLGTGDYRYSYKLPIPIQSISLNKEIMSVITLDEQKLEIWKPTFPGN